MAKSLRSKWRRKCRAVKRERYGKKEMDRLKKTLGIDETQNGTSSKDVAMADIAEIVTVTTAKKIKQKQNEAKNDDEDTMDIDTVKRNFNNKTLRDQNGSYPIWLHPRKYKKAKTKKGKKGKSKK